MASWDPAKFSNVRVTTDRRYLPSSAALPDSDAANAGQVFRRPGERPAGFRPDGARDLLDGLGKGGAITAAGMGGMGGMGGITDEELEGRARGINMARGDVRGIMLGREAGQAAPIKRGDVLGTANTFFAPAAAQSEGVMGAVRNAGSGGTAAAATTAALWGGPMAAQDPTAWVGRPEAPAASTSAASAYPAGATWQRMGVPTPFAAAASAEYGAANRGAPPLTEYDVRVGVNGMADFDEDEGAYPEGDLGMGVPRRQDLGLATEYPSPAWRGLVSQGGGAAAVMQTGRQTTGNQSGRGVAGDALARRLVADHPAASFDAKWSDGVFGHGDSVDAVFVGVHVDPYTGVEYDLYENEAPAPTGDYRQKDSGMQRRFEGMMGGSAPGRPQRRKVEVEGDWSEAAPDVDGRDWVEYARLRGMEAARREDLMGPHADDAAWQDAEGYKSLPKGDMPANKIGYNDAVRFPAMPALHLHAGMLATPMTGGGVQPGDGSDVPGAGFMPPEIAVRVKRAPVFSTHGGVGGHGDMEGAYMGGLAEQRDPLRAPMRVGRHGEQAADGLALVGEGAYMGGLAEQRDPLRAPMRVGRAGEQYADGMALTGEGAYMGGLAELRDPLRAPVRIGRAGEHYTDGAAVAGEGAYVPAEDVLTHTLSQRPKLVLALGRAFSNIVTGVDGAMVPPESFPETLRTMAHNPMGWGRAIIDVGLTGPGTGGLADYTQHKAPHRHTDTRAMAIGDVGMALVTSLGEYGSYVPPELVDLKPQERDAVTLALGRAIVHMMDGAAVAGGAPSMPAEAYEEVRRQPAFVEALGRLAIQLADDAGAAYVPPQDWAAAQSKDRVQPIRSTAEWARQVGSHLVNIASEVEAAGTGGLIRFRDPLRGDSIVGGVLGGGIDTGVEGPGTAMMADPDAVRKRKLDQYALAIAARLYGINAHAEDAGPGTAALMEWTRRSRAKNDHPNLRGSAPFRVVDGHEGLAVGTDAFLRMARIQNDRGPNTRAAAADSSMVQSAAPTREVEWTRYGHRFGGAPVAARADNYGSSGHSSAYQDDYSAVDSKYMEVAQ